MCPVLHLRRVLKKYIWIKLTFQLSFLSITRSLIKWSTITVPWIYRLHKDNSYIVIIEIKSPFYTIAKIRHNNVSITISDTFLLDKHIYYLFCVLCLVNTLYDSCLVNWQQCLLRAHRSHQGILVGLTSIQSVHHH